MKLVINPAPIYLVSKFVPIFQDNPGLYEFYGDVEEELLLDDPVPIGKGVQVTMWVDADHGNYLMTSHSHTGAIIFFNSELIVWYSKRQATNESSIFGSDMVALRTALDIMKILRYKPRMVGMELLWITILFGDN